MSPGCSGFSFPSNSLSVSPLTLNEKLSKEEKGSSILNNLEGNQSESFANCFIEIETRTINFRETKITS
jgi:hypothetical protein